jgi:hypothetical protein
MNGKRCVKPINDNPKQPQKRPLLRRTRMGREPPKLQLLNFGKPKVKPTYVPRFLPILKSDRLDPDERRLAEQRVDKNMNDALKMNNDERITKYGVVDMKNIHAKLFNAERKKIISMREKKLKEPIVEKPVIKPSPCAMPVQKEITKVVSPQQLIREFLRDSPVQIIRPKKTISQMMREEDHIPALPPKAPKGGVYDRIAKKAGLRVAKPKQTKIVKEKAPVELYEKERCSKKTSNKPYTVSQLRRIAKSMNIPKDKIVDAKSSVKKLCELIDLKKKNASPKKDSKKKSVNNTSMKRRIEHAKKVLQKDAEKKPIKKEHKIISPKKDGTPWMNRSPHSRKRHANVKDNVYIKALATLKKDEPVMFLKMKGFNAERVGRKTKGNPNPHTQNNLMKIASELNINIPTTSKKPKPTATQLIALIKKKLEKA